MATNESRRGGRINGRGWTRGSLRAAVGTLAMTAGACLGQTCDGLVARWAFNGDATDATGNGHNAALVGGSFAGGRDGQAYQLGGGAYAEIADAPDLNPTTAITVSAWWFATSFSGTGNDPILDKPYGLHVAPYYQYHLGVTGDTYDNTQRAINFDCATESGNHQVFAPAGTWTSGHWYHVVGTYDGVEARIYVNGKLRATKLASGRMVDFGRNIRIGRYGNRVETLPGAVDEVRIYNRALSAAEIRVLANNPVGNPLAEPAATAACPGGALSLSVTAVGVGPFLYQWRRDGVPIDVSVNPSAATATLTIVSASGSDAGTYDCVVNGASACGDGVSNPALVSVRDCPYGACPADYDASGGTPDSSDIGAFFTDWLAGAECADADCSGGTPDSADIDAFFSAWLAGGC